MNRVLFDSSDLLVLANPPVFLRPLDVLVMSQPDGSYFGLSWSRCVWSGVHHKCISDVDLGVVAHGHITLGDFHNFRFQPQVVERMREFVADALTHWNINGGVCVPLDGGKGTCFVPDKGNLRNVVRLSISRFAGNSRAATAPKNFDWQMLCFLRKSLAQISQEAPRTDDFHVTYHLNNCEVFDEFTSSELLKF